MDLTQYVDGLQRDLVAAAAASDEQTRAAAERLGVALGPAARLALIEALTEAAAEISAELPAGSVEVRLRGREPQFVVDVPAPAAAEPQPADPTDEAGDDDNVVRITLRLPESVKGRAEELAARHGQSLNTWLVAAARRAQRERPLGIDVDLSRFPFSEGPADPSSPSPGARSMTGWV